MKQKAFNVYCGSRLIDTVYFDDYVTADEVRQSLINHDGYDRYMPTIVVKEKKK